MMHSQRFSTEDSRCSLIGGFLPVQDDKTVMTSVSTYVSSQQESYLLHDMTMQGVTKYKAKTVT